MNTTEEVFVTALVYETQGDTVAAATIAAYNDPEVDGPKAAKRLKHQIVEALEMAIILQAPKAVFALVEALKDSTVPGTRERVAAAKDILDRSGIVGATKVTVSAAPGLFILPAKRDAE